MCTLKNWSRPTDISYEACVTRTFGVEFSRVWRYVVCMKRTQSNCWFNRLQHHPSTFAFLYSKPRAFAFIAGVENVLWWLMKGRWRVQAFAECLSDEILSQMVFMSRGYCSLSHCTLTHLKANRKNRYKGLHVRSSNAGRERDQGRKRWVTRDKAFPETFLLLPKIARRRPFSYISQSSSSKRLLFRWSRALFRPCNR